ncbi:protein kinase, putative [Trypanosoma cruzi marinkellei]|uniref:Protein kinase, putative n=1 Tax=Trypanosoma cruzi marinkellei TaxID=85056 RepID=K2NW07_TRYCR|nr:protein kinase, putative [Trypanosoma cruzi marinkellei]
MVCTEECSNTSFTLDIIAEGQTEISDVVEDEIEFLKQNYDGIEVVKLEGFYPKVLLTLEVESNPRHRVVLEIAIVAGYPFVAPIVRLRLPEGVTPGSIGALDETGARQLQADIREAISPCLLVGAPCIMQIISVVERVLSNGIQRSCTPPHVKSTDTVEHPPSQTTMKTWEVIKLCVLLLHLLNKCCHLRDPESMEEAKSNFQILGHYLINDVKVIPKKLQKCIPWKYDYTQRAFRENVRESMDGSDIITKWFWSHEEGSGTFQNISPGRYKNEFIQQRMLGSGGFAPVFVCRKKVDGRLYAVKKILTKKDQSEKVLREVQSLAALSHKNIVRYYDAWMEPGCDEDLINYAAALSEEETESNEARNFVLSGAKASSRSFWYDCSDTSSEEDSSSDKSCSSTSLDGNSPPGVLCTPYIAHSDDYHTLYIQMELCSKHTLRHMIEESDRGEKSLFLSENGEKMAARIFRQLLTVVAHFHRERIVHRDLKPDNILFEMEGSASGGEIEAIRVADFGLARTMVHATVRRNQSSFEMDDPNAFAGFEAGGCPTGNLGSVLYCAPEQERGEDYDFKVDEYSLGMIALEMWLAVAGKGFRERFNIMTDVSRGNKLPEWFCKWNPRMANAIASLIEPDPTLRRSCEELLMTADLPGDPADIVEALETIERHGERITSRVLHCIQKTMMTNYRKPPSQEKESLKVIANTILCDLMQTINLIGYLHGALPAASCDSMVPMNPSLSDLDVPFTLDMRSRAWAIPFQPQLATAYFVCHMTSPLIGSFYQFFCRKRPYAIFTTPLGSSGTVDEAFLDPLLSFFHLLSVFDLTSKLDIIISHAHWLNAAHPRDATSKVPFDELLEMNRTIESSDLILPLVSRMDEVFVNAGLLRPSWDRLELIRSFASLLLEVLPLFGKQVASNISLSIDPTLKPCETSVDRFFLEHGLILECRTQGEGRPVAFFCNLENFVSKCLARGSDMSAVSLSIDLMELGPVGKHLYFQQKSLLLSGVAISRQDVYSPNQMSAVIMAAAKVWTGNVRACLRVHHDTRTFCKAMKMRNLPVVLLDGVRFASLESVQHGKVRTRKDVVSGDLCVAIRKLNGVELMDDVQPRDPAIFLRDEKSKTFSAEEAREIYSIIVKSLSHILVVDLEVKTVECGIKRIMGNSATTEPETPKLTDLIRWLKSNMSTHDVLPVFSTQDRTVTFFVNQKIFRRIGHNDNGRRKK